MASERRKGPSKTAMSHYYDTGDAIDVSSNQRAKGDQSLPKIRTYDQNQLKVNSQRNQNLDN